MENSTGSELWTTLKASYTFEWDTLKTKKTIVQLKLIGNEKLNTSLINEGKVLDKFYINGKIKEDYFSIDKKLTVIPLFPIYTNLIIKRRVKCV